VRRNTFVNDPLATFGLTAVRVALGVWWLSQFSWKPPPTFGCPNGGFCLWLDKEIANPLIPLYADMLRAVVRPNAIIFGWFSFAVETALGIGFIFGIFTRLAGLVGTLWSLNLLIGLVAVPGETAWYYLSMILLDFLYFTVGSTGQVAVDRVER
jgi:hypothetical protein